jgi:hypothetical protein
MLSVRVDHSRVLGEVRVITVYPSGFAGRCSWMRAHVGTRVPQSGGSVTLLNGSGGQRRQHGESANHRPSPSRRLLRVSGLFSSILDFRFGFVLRHFVEDCFSGQHRHHDSRLADLSSGDSEDVLR